MNSPDGHTNPRVLVKAHGLPERFVMLPADGLPPGIGDWLPQLLAAVRVLSFNDHPEDDQHFAVTVEHRGEGQWAVCHMGYCFNAAGQSTYEPQVSNREEEWLAQHRFDLPTAIRLALHVAPLITCNGMTARQCWDRQQAGRAARS